MIPLASLATPITLLLADWVAPMDRTPLRDAGVALGGGKIVAVDSARSLRARFPGSTVEELGQAVLLPGLVNAHVHLELSALTPGERPGRFVDWLKRLVPVAPPSLEAVRAFVERGIEIGVGQCLQFGVTTVGDISRQCSITRPLLRAGPLRAVSFGEVQAMARRRGALTERLGIACDRAEAGARLRIGVSPHAPYSIEAEGYRQCLHAARDAGMPLATHLAETSAEREFLAEQTGEFRELWDYLGDWDAQVPTFPGGPVRYAAELGLLDYPTVLAHVNHCDDAEMQLLARGKASVACCPRTHAYFGHPPHRWREMIAAGINVAVATDSCASSPDLNLVDDLRLLHELAPSIPTHDLWQMATLAGARALGWQDQVGSLTPGKAGDVIVFGVRSHHPLEEILETARLPIAVWIDAKRVAGTQGKQAGVEVVS